MRYRDLTGEIFGRLRVLRHYSFDAAYNGAKRKVHRWECRCFCGDICIVRGGQLIRGQTQTCGCTRMANMAASRRTHGEAEQAREKRRVA